MSILATIKAKLAPVVARTRQRLVDASRGVFKKRSAKWDGVRDTHMKGNPWCAGCGCRDVQVLNVHHKKPFHLFPELELDPANLITLCESGRRCHLDLGHEGNWKGWNPAIVADANRMLRMRAQKGEVDALAVCPRAPQMKAVHANGARLAEKLATLMAMPSEMARRNYLQAVLRQDPVLYTELKGEFERLRRGSGLPPEPGSDTLPVK